MEKVLVTGASSGIGLALAELFARDGRDLVIVARREEILNSVASRFKEDYGIDVTVIPKDLTLKKSPQETKHSRTFMIKNFRDIYFQNKNVMESEVSIFIE